MDHEILRMIRGKIVGSDFRMAKELYGGSLVVGLGKKYHKEDTKKVYFEWEIFFRPPWRIVNGADLVCSSENDSKNISEILSEINLGKVVNIETVNEKDIFFVFGNGLRIDVLNLSIDYEALSIVHKRESEYELYFDKWVQYDPHERIRKLTEIEEILDSSSEECHEIWSKVIPVNTTEYLCNECFYFRAIDGHFYFWDYGLCSNKASEYCGKLVGVHSGCCGHRCLKDLIGKQSQSVIL